MPDEFGTGDICAVIAWTLSFQRPTFNDQRLIRDIAYEYKDLRGKGVSGM